MKNPLLKSPYAAIGAGALLGAGAAGILGWRRYKSGEINGTQFAVSIVTRAVLFGGVSALSALGGRGTGGVGLLAMSLFGLGGMGGRGAGALAGVPAGMDADIAGAAQAAVGGGQGRGGNGGGQGRGGNGGGQGRGAGSGRGKNSGLRSVTAKGQAGQEAAASALAQPSESGGEPGVDVPPEGAAGKPVT